MPCYPAKDPDFLIWFRVDKSVAKLTETIWTQRSWDELLAASERIGDENSRLHRRADGKFIKIFPTRGRSLAKTQAQAFAFVANAERLRSRGFSCPVPEELVFVAEELAFVVYEPLAGESFREWFEHEDKAELGRLPAYFVHLHELGIYFRGAHLGNLMRESGEGMGLIDFSDVKFHPGALGPWKRARNLAHLLDNRLDGDLLKAYGYDRFVEAYCDLAELSPFAVKRLNWFLRRRIGEF